MAKPGAVNYKLICSIVYSGTVDNGHYLTYVRNENETGFQEFDGYDIHGLSDDDVLETLKTGAYVLAYKREGPFPSDV
jgi:ubiquitin C-terminal hydrolase